MTIVRSLTRGLALVSLLVGAPVAAQNVPGGGIRVHAPPAWSRNAVIYEVNVRQFTPQGTFAALQKHLPRLKRLGVDVLWLMPVQPIGKLNRKGTLGSYYSISATAPVATTIAFSGAVPSSAAFGTGRPTCFSGRAAFRRTPGRVTV